MMTIAYGGSQMRDLVVYGLMIVTLLLRPQGLLAAHVPSSGSGCDVDILRRTVRRHRHFDARRA